MKDKFELHTDDIKQISVDFDNPAGISNITVDAIVDELPTAKPKRKLFKRIKCFFIRHKWVLGWWRRRCGKQKRIRLQTFKRNFMISKESIEHLRKINKRMIDKNKLNHELDTWNYFCLFNKKPKSDTPLIDTGELRSGLRIEKER